MKQLTRFTPPPPRKLTAPLALVLALLVLAAPVSAQTITAPGMIGQPACAGPGETDDPVSGSVSNITANSANTTTDLYSNL